TPRRGPEYSPPLGMTIAIRPMPGLMNCTQRSIKRISGGCDFARRPRVVAAVVTLPSSAGVTGSLDLIRGFDRFARDLGEARRIHTEPSGGRDDSLGRDPLLDLCANPAALGVVPYLGQPRAQDLGA